MLGGERLSAGRGSGGYWLTRRPRGEDGDDRTLGIEIGARHAIDVGDGDGLDGVHDVVG